MQKFEIRNRISVVMLGEKDHGKSTLIGRLIFEIKSMPEDRLREVRGAVKKFGRIFEWAHLLDSFRYEREHEMTLDTTRALVKFGKNLYEFIDVPGHKELIKNMLTGASDARYGILVIDAKEGVTPQTLRHLEIAKFLGIRKIITVVNKMDKINYSQAKFEEIKKRFKNVIPAVAFKGENLIKKSRKLKWFRGPTLQKAIQKEFKSSGNSSSKQKSFKYTRDFRAICIFVENPHKNLALESDLDFKSHPIKLNGFAKLNSLQNVSLSAERPLIVSEKFVIKTRGRIIGICRHLT